MPAYPKCQVCPKCSSDEYVKARPEGVAFVSDRICESCSTRYRPPIPAWASWIVILFGGLLGLLGVLGIVGTVWIAGQARQPGTVLAGILCTLIVAAIGSVSALHGASWLREKLIDPDEPDN